MPSRPSKNKGQSRRPARKEQNPAKKFSFPFRRKNPAHAKSEMQRKLFCWLASVSERRRGGFIRRDSFGKKFGFCSGGTARVRYTFLEIEPNKIMIKNLKLGFSTGALYKSVETKEAISVIKNLGCKAIEIGFVRVDKFLNSGQLERIEKSDLEGFDHVSFHAPKFDYDNDKETINIFEKISNFNKEIRQLDLVVFHPDTVKDFSIFDDVDFKVGFENMDYRKGSCRTVEDIEQVLSKNSKFKLILDVNHVWINDPTMELAQDFYKKLGDKIAQIHLSGFKELHDPLFETKQLEIIKAIQNLDVPIIIESVVTPETIKKENDYILDNIGLM